MAKGKAETELSKAVADQLDKLGVFHLRLQSGKVKVKRGWMYLCPIGTPDRMILLDGRAVFIEVKRAGETPTPEQLQCHEMIRLNGGVVLVVESAAQAWEQVRMLRREIRQHLDSQWSRLLESLD